MFPLRPGNDADRLARQGVKVPPARPRADFRHVDNWIFDLDNTLYSADADLFDQIETRMTLFLRNRFAVDADEANRIRKSYFRDYGTTLSGLMRVDGIDPEDFLSFVHDIDLAALSPSADMRAALARLPGRRFVFTNGCAKHAARILDRMQIAEYFHDIWDIRTIGFVPKPAPESYATVIGRANIAADTAAMFEDTARNLVPAHDMGMTTVWLRTRLGGTHHGPQMPRVEAHHIHHQTDHLSNFLHALEVATRP